MVLSFSSCGKQKASEKPVEVNPISQLTENRFYIRRAEANFNRGTKNDTSSTSAAASTSFVASSSSSSNSSSASSQSTTSQSATKKYKDEQFVSFYNGAYGTIQTYNASNKPENKRVLWFKDNFDSIPTLYPEDTIVYKFKNVFAETFTFERFEDLGYTIGLKNISTRPSGRWYLSTEANSGTTYPGGDTDVILKFGVKTVTMESFAGYETAGLNLKSLLSRAGTIKGLEKGKYYTAEFYSGTYLTYDPKLYDPENPKPDEIRGYKFVADVRVLCSMEGFKISDYDYVDDELIEVHFPKNMKTGYYSMQGAGLFRYIAEGDDENDPDLDYNVPTNVPLVTKRQVILPAQVPEYDILDEDAYKDSLADYNGNGVADILEGKKVEEGEYAMKSTEYVSKTIELNPGTVTVTTTVIPHSPNSEAGAGVNANSTDLSALKILIVDPDKIGTHTLTAAANDKLTYSATFPVSERGEYEIRYYGLQENSVNTNIQYR